jgi:hypothetical protein
VDAPDARNALIEHKKSKCFLGEDHQTLKFSSQITYTCWGNGTGGKIGASEAIQKRLEWENLIFFAGYYILSVHDSHAVTCFETVFVGGLVKQIFAITYEPLDSKFGGTPPTCSSPTKN